MLFYVVGNLINCFQRSQKLVKKNSFFSFVCKIGLKKKSKINLHIEKNRRSYFPKKSFYSLFKLRQFLYISFDQNVSCLQIVNQIKNQSVTVPFLEIMEFMLKSSILLDNKLCDRVSLTNISLKGLRLQSIFLYLLQYYYGKGLTLDHKRGPQ